MALSGRPLQPAGPSRWWWAGLALIWALLPLPGVAAQEAGSAASRGGIELQGLETHSFPHLRAQFVARDLHGEGLAWLSPSEVFVTLGADTLPLEGLRADGLDPRGMTAILVVDHSQSMGPRMEELRAGLLDLLARFPHGSRIGLVTVSARAAMALAPTLPRDALTQRISALESGGGTALWDGLFMALELLEEDSRPQDRRAVVLVTDGYDTRSTRSLGQVLPRVRAVGAPILSITVGEGADMASLQSITRESRGVLAEWDAARGLRADLAAVFPGMEVQYQVVVRAPEALLGSWQDFALAVRPDGADGGDLAMSQKLLLHPGSISNPDLRDDASGGGLARWGLILALLLITSLLAVLGTLLMRSRMLRVSRRNRSRLQFVQAAAAVLVLLIAMGLVGFLL